MTLPTKEPNKYTIELTKGLGVQYALDPKCEFEKCHAVGKEAFHLIAKRLQQPDGQIEFNQLMAAMAVAVQNMAFMLDNEQVPSDTPNDWFSTAFPEFCSLIGPGSGFAHAKMEKGKSIFKGDEPVNVTLR